MNMRNAQLELVRRCLDGEATGEGRASGFAWLIMFDSNTEAFFA